MKIGNTIFEVSLVFVPGHLVHADSRIPLELVEARSQQFFVDVMQQGSELEVATLAYLGPASALQLVESGY